MRELCPVCKTEVAENDIKCKNCGFEELHKVFISKIDAEEWIEKVVTPKRHEYEQLQKTTKTTATKELSPVEKLKAEVDILNIELNSHSIKTQKELYELCKKRKQLHSFEKYLIQEVDQQISQLNNESNNKTNELQAEINTKNTQIKLHEGKIGDTVLFGSYSQDLLSCTQQSIEWTILDREENKVLLLSKYCLFSYPADEFCDTEWANSLPRNRLNSCFYDEAFSDFEKTQIINVKPHNVISNITNEITKCTFDKVFCLTQGEIEKYFPNKNMRKATATQIAIRVAYRRNAHLGEKVDWLIINNLGCHQYINSDGEIVSFSQQDFISYIGDQPIFSVPVIFIRPAIWVSINQKN